MMLPPAAAAADDDDDDMCHLKGMGNVCCSKSLTSHHAWAICFVLWVNTAVFLTKVQMLHR